MEGFITFEPSEYLEFRRPFRQQRDAVLTIANNSSRSIAFRVRASAATLYRIAPTWAQVKPWKKETVTIVQMAMEQEPPDAESRDTFQVECIQITRDLQRMSVQEIFSSMDRSREPVRIHKHVLKVAYLPLLRGKAEGRETRGSIDHEPSGPRGRNTKADHQGMSTEDLHTVAVQHHPEQDPERTVIPSEEAIRRQKFQKREVSPRTPRRPPSPSPTLQVSTSPPLQMSASRESLPLAPRQVTTSPLLQISAQHSYHESSPSRQVPNPSRALPPPPAPWAPGQPSLPQVPPSYEPRREPPASSLGQEYSAALPQVSPRSSRHELSVSLGQESSTPPQASSRHLRHGSSVTPLGQAPSSNLPQVGYQRSHHETPALPSSTEPLAGAASEHQHGESLPVPPLRKMSTSSPRVSPQPPHREPSSQPLGQASTSAQHQEFSHLPRRNYFPPHQAPNPSPSEVLSWPPPSQGLVPPQKVVPEPPYREPSPPPQVLLQPQHCEPLAPPPGQVSDWTSPRHEPSRQGDTSISHQSWVSNQPSHHQFSSSSPRQMLPTHESSRRYAEDGSKVPIEGLPPHSSTTPYSAASEPEPPLYTQLPDQRYGQHPPPAVLKEDVERHPLYQELLSQYNALAMTQHSQYPPSATLKADVEGHPKYQKLLSRYNAALADIKELRSETSTTMSTPSGEDGPNACLLTSLLNILKINMKRTGHVSSAVNPENISLVRQLLEPEDYDHIIAKLGDNYDVEVLFNFFFSLLDGGHLSSASSEDAKRKVRRLMLKGSSTRPIMPQLLYLSGVAMDYDSGRSSTGGFGFVHFGKYRGVEVAVKMLYTDDKTAFYKEALIWRTLSHRYVLPLLGIFYNPPPMSYCFVSPYMRNGTLCQWRNTNPPLNEIHARILEVALGVQYLHSEGVVHGDLRGSNILLDSEFHVQIADFGPVDVTATRCGAMSYHFAAPELFGGGNDMNAQETLLMTKTILSDVYAFGSLYYEIYFNEAPFKGRAPVQIAMRVVRGERPALPQRPPLGRQSWKLIQDCWLHNKNERPSMDGIVRRINKISPIYKVQAPT